MFSNTKNSKQQGNVGIGAAIAYFTSQGYTVSLPLNDSQDYDLIVDNGQLYKVQVKTTYHRVKSGAFKVCLKSSGGSSRKVYARLMESSCNFLFVLTSDGDRYLIPESVFKKYRNSLSLNGNVEEYKV